MSAPQQWHRRLGTRQRQDPDVAAGLGVVCDEYDRAPIPRPTERKDLIVRLQQCLLATAAVGGPLVESPLAVSEQPNAMALPSGDQIGDDCSCDVSNVTRAVVPRATSLTQMSPPVPS